jgi:hypothetical protein
LGIVLDVFVSSAAVAFDGVAEGLQEDGATKLGDHFIAEILSFGSGEGTAVAAGSWIVTRSRDPFG